MAADTWDKGSTMHIKKQTVIPANFKITRVSPGVANATSLKVLRAREEDRLMGNTRPARTADDSESDSEMRMERYHMARGAGLSESDSLDEMNGYGHDDRDSPRWER